MSAIRGRPPKDRDAAEKADAIRSPKASDLLSDAARREDKRDKEQREKDKKERTKALDDLAPPVAPKASPALPTGTHHSRTQTAPPISRPSGSMISRSTTVLASSDGAPRAGPIASSEYGDRRRLTMSGAALSRASISGASRDEKDDKDKDRIKPRARDDDVLSDVRRERYSSLSAGDSLRRSKVSALPTSPPPAVNDLQIPKQPKPYQDPRLSTSGSPDSTARSPTISRVSVVGVEKDPGRKERRDKTETPDPDARPSRRTQRDGDKEARDKDRGETKDKETKDADREKDKEERTVRSSSGGSRISTRGSRIGEAPPLSPQTISQPALASPSTPLSPQAFSPSTSPAVLANKSTAPLGAPLSTSPSPSTIAPAKPEPSAPALTSPPISPSPSLSPSVSSTTPTSPVAQPAPPVSTNSAPSLVGVPKPAAATGQNSKDDIAVGDRLKLFMNVSPRASQSMLNMSSPQLQALRDKHKPSRQLVPATEPMDLKEVVLKMRDPNYGLELKETKIGFFTTKKCTTGTAFVDWLLAQKVTESGARADAVAIATVLLIMGNIELAKAVNEKEKEKDMFFDSASLYTLPKSEEDKKKDKVKEPKEIHSPRSPRRRWFGAALPEMMEAGEKVPRVVTALLNAVLFMNGSRTEGIFRISPEGSLIDSLKEQLERGNLTIPGQDPHVPACCLKLFLRELRQPVIPDALYEECIRATDSAAAVQEVVAKLPETNRNLLMALVQFLVELASPDNSQVTKMPVSNLAVVFAPCLLRCPLANPLDIMRNSSLEQMFVQALIESQCPPSYTRPAQPSAPRTISVPLKDGDGGSPIIKSGSSSGKRMDLTNGTQSASSSPSGSGKALMMMSTNVPLSAAITTIDVGNPVPRGESGGKRLNDSTGSGGRKDTGGSAGSSGKRIEALNSSSSASTPDCTTAIPATEAAKDSAPVAASSADVPPTMAKSEPVPIPSAVAGANGLSVSSVTTTASSPVSPSESFSPPASPATVATESITPGAQGEDAQLLQLLAAADPVVAAKVGPQLRDVRQRLATAEASKDLELAGFYRTQVDALRKQLGEEKKAM